MSRTVFILGAGASKATGAPLMCEFLDKAEELLFKSGMSGNLKEFKTDFNRVFEVIWNIRQAVFEKSTLNLDSIEEVLALFEMGKIIKRIPGISDDTELDQLITSARRMVFMTLQETVEFPYVKGRFIDLPDETYGKLSKLLIKLKLKCLYEYLDPHGCSVITFNYDIALDHALAHSMRFNRDSKLEVDYGLEFKGRDRGVTSIPMNIPLLKLHGSLNWFMCKGCGKIFTYNLNDKLMIGALKNSTMQAVFSERKRCTVDLYNTISSYVNRTKCQQCGAKNTFEPFIVPPSWNKTEYHKVLENVWNQAATELSEAENIYISGYSLPETDYFFKYLFALGAIGRDRIKKFWVFDPDDSDVVAKRYDAIIGAGIKKRFKYLSLSFNEALDYILKDMKISLDEN